MLHCRKQNVALQEPQECLDLQDKLGSTQKLQSRGPNVALQETQKVQCSKPILQANSANFALQCLLGFKNPHLQIKNFPGCSASEHH